MALLPDGLVTLISDFGLQDPFVGCMKGVIASLAPAARVVDLCHDIPPQDVDAAGFWLSRSFNYFPPGTVHVAVVDPGVGGARGLLLVTAAGHCLLAPDNGLLTPFLTLPEARAVLVSTEVQERFALPDRSATFHGRDVIAPLAAALVTGRLETEQAGEVAHAPVAGGLPPVIMSAGQVQGQVVVVDHFGNLITNIDGALIGKKSALEVWAGGHQFAFRKTYSEAEPDEVCALLNSFNVVEIACRNGSAQRAVGIAKGDIVQVISPQK